jgi:hypothetical protein
VRHGGGKDVSVELSVIGDILSMRSVCESPSLKLIFIN